MTSKQRALQFIYPLFKKIARWRSADPGVQANQDKKEPKLSFHNLSAQLINGMPFNFDELKGKKVLLVNVASNCGYTPQYEELEQLNRLYKGKLVILAFPANDFKKQEPENDSQIEAFCKVNFGVSFPLFKKNPVLGTYQQKVFQWLSQKSKNGWNEQPPSWNFCKYLVDGNGKLQYYFASYISPLDKEMIRAINSI